jgi:hypothetical protein
LQKDKETTDLIVDKDRCLPAGIGSDGEKRRRIGF